MAFGEFIKAIQWNLQSTSEQKYGVVAYLVQHSGAASAEPVTSLKGDPVWYVHGEVNAVSTPTPHLAGTLGDLYVTDATGQMVSKSNTTVNVQLFPNGTMTIQRLINNHPIGGLPPIQLQATPVGDDLMMAIYGDAVWTAGVARMPEDDVFPK